MNRPAWFSVSAEKLGRTAVPLAAAADPPVAPAAAAASVATAPAPVARVPGGGRTLAERLKATLRKDPEALTPRALRRMLAELQAVIEPQVSEVEGGRRAQDLGAWYHGAAPGERHDFWLLMSEQFVADQEAARRARAKYLAAVGTPDEAVAEVKLRRSTVSPRRRLLQRFSVFPDGIRFLVDLRADMVPHLKADKRLHALDVEMEYMFSTWFDVAFLELRRISWDSPASLIEKLIRYEAVHDIRGWSDVKNRLDSDRRCYGFFHPRLPGEPLIFVEVAMLDEISAAIPPLLDESAAPADLASATTAIFYSISNTQTGLRGVSFGDSLIKRVVETLKEEFPRLKVFATLSPIPGLRPWLAKRAGSLLEPLNDKHKAELARAAGVDVITAETLLAALDKPLELGPKSPLRQFLLAGAAHYLGREQQQERPVDPVARFHLGNGARIERLNWAGDPSAKGLKQSYGLMVNYLYDLKRLDKHRAQLAQGKIPVSGAIDELYF